MISSYRQLQIFALSASTILTGWTFPYMFYVIDFVKPRMEAGEYKPTILVIFLLLLIMGIIKVVHRIANGQAPKYRVFCQVIFGYCFAWLIILAAILLFYPSEPLVIP